MDSHKFLTCMLTSLYGNHELAHKCKLQKNNTGTTSNNGWATILQHTRCFKDISIKTMNCACESTVKQRSPPHLSPPSCTVFSPAYLRHVGPASLHHKFYFNIGMERGQKL